MAHSVVHRVEESKAPWLYDGSSFWTYEDPISIAYKVDYAQHHRMGGLMIWELSGDDASGTLLRAAYMQLTHPELHAAAGEGNGDAAVSNQIARSTMDGRKVRCN